MMMIDDDDDDDDAGGGGGGDDVDYNSYPTIMKITIMIMMMYDHI